MFGINIDVCHNDVRVRLRPATKSDISEITKYFSSMKIHLYTHGLFGQTEENEMEWYEKNRKDPNTCLWLIEPEGHNKPVGITGLHGLSNQENTCTSGIIIWDSSWWGKGIASAAHIGRTYFAASYLNRFTIRSLVRTANRASCRALEKVGYTVWGEEPIDVYRGGVWLSTYHLIWIRPDMISYLFPMGVPAKYEEGIQKATKILELAKNEIVFP